VSVRRFGLRFVIALVLATAATSVGVVAGSALFEREYERSEKVPLRQGVLDELEQGEPGNFLVIGSDTRAVVDDEGEAGAFGSQDDVGGERSDTIMVVHVDPDHKTGFVVSFPRDLWVRIPGHGDAKINRAFGLGGPELVIATLQENFGIEIHHYLEVDFDGFRSVVDTIGGVELQFNAPARDAYSGLDIPEAGCIELTGDQALAYTRSRFYEAYDADDDRWRRDPRSDLSRIERQQYFLRTLGDRALSRSRDLVTAYRLATDVFDYVKRDPDLTFDDVKGLINSFRDLDPELIEMTTVPTDSAMRDGESVQLARQDETEALMRRLTFRAVEADLPEFVPANEITIVVSNGSGERGWGAEVLDAFVAHGFVPAGEARDADSDDYRETEVRYAPGAGSKGLTVAYMLDTANVRPATVPLDVGVDVEIVVGDDWDALAAPVKEAPQTTPTTAPTAVAPTSSTTTTVPRADPMFVPTDPETGGPLVGCP